MTQDDMMDVAPGKAASFNAITPNEVLRDVQAQLKECHEALVQYDQGNENYRAATYHTLSAIQYLDRHFDVPL